MASILSISNHTVYEGQALLFDVVLDTATVAEQSFTFSVSRVHNGTVTVASISGNTLSTIGAHELEVGSTFTPRSTSNGLQSNVKYYVISVPSTTSFTLSATMEGSQAAFTDGTGLSIVGDTATLQYHGIPGFTDGVRMNSNETITVPTGVSRFKVIVPTTYNDISEPDLSVVISIGGVQGTGTVVDNQPTVSVFALNPSISELAVEEALVLFKLSNRSANDTVISFSLTGSAAQGNDYTIEDSSSVTIPAGELEVTTLVTVTNDDDPEPTESVIVTITSATTNSKSLVAAVPTATIVIEDAPSVSVFVTPGAITETIPQTAKFYFQLSKACKHGVQVSFTLIESSAAINIDYAFVEPPYTAVANSILIPAGELFATAEVITLEDAQLENALETVVARITGAVADGVSLPIGLDKAVLTILDKTASTLSGGDPSTNCSFVQEVDYPVADTTTLTLPLDVTTPIGTDVTVPTIEAVPGGVGKQQNTTTTASISAGSSSVSVTVNTDLEFLKTGVAIEFRHSYEVTTITGGVTTVTPGVVMLGRVTSYNSSTGALVASIHWSSFGTGSYAGWHITPAGNNAPDYTEHYDRMITAFDTLSNTVATLSNNINTLVERQAVLQGIMANNLAMLTNSTICMSGRLSDIHVEEHSQSLSLAQIATDLQRLRDLGEGAGIHVISPYGVFGDVVMYKKFIEQGGILDKTRTVSSEDQTRAREALAEYIALLETLDLTNYFNGQ